MMSLDKNINRNAHIGILKEIKSPWERRTPLTPKGCKELIEMGVKVTVQPSKIRCFSDDEYAEVGCEVNEDLSKCSLIIGLQEPDQSVILPDRTYMIFGQCKKGKTENKLFLERVLDNKIRFIDYECIKKNDGSQRLVSFGDYAGIAGTINLFKGIGELLLARQVSTPFMYLKLAYMYADVEDADKNLRTLGTYLQEQYLPEEFSPFTIAVLGTGRVSQGVQKALRCLPIKFLSPSELVKGEFEKRRDTIYVVVFDFEDIYSKITSSSTHSNLEYTDVFDKDDFIISPENYKSEFDTKYLKYFHAIINCLYWESRYPRILTKCDLKKHVTQKEVKLIGISDISCDLNGPIEILQGYTSFSKPFFIYEPVLEKQIDHVDNATKEGIIYHAIPNLAASFSTDASESFCRLLLPYLKNLVFSPYPVKFEEQTDLLPELRNACISSDGVLTPKYRNIFRNTEEKTKVEASKSEQGSRPYFLSLKLKGNLFDSGFFNILINDFVDLGMGHKINFLSIGEGEDLPSILYCDIYGDTIDQINLFMNMTKKKVEEHKLECNILKTNII